MAACTNTDLPLAWEARSGRETDKRAAPDMPSPRPARRTKATTPKPCARLVLGAERPDGDAAGYEHAYKTNTAFGVYHQAEGKSSLVELGVFPAGS